MKKILVYSTPSCIYCNMIKSFFKANGVDYEDYDISTNIEKRKEMIEKTGQMGIPVIDIEGEIVIGYNEPRVREILGIKG